MKQTCEVGHDPTADRGGSCYDQGLGQGGDDGGRPGFVRQSQRGLESALIEQGVNQPFYPRPWRARMARRTDQAANGSESPRACTERTGRGVTRLPIAIAASRRTAASRSARARESFAVDRLIAAIPAERAAWSRTFADGSASAAAIAFLAIGPPIASSPERVQPACFGSAVFSRVDEG